MAARRSAKEVHLSDGQDSQEQSPSDTSPSVPADVIYKLLAFTAAMICCPLGTYFVSLDTIFQGNSTFAGAAAALAANIVLVAYIIVAMREDQEDKALAEEAKHSKKME